MSSLAQVKALAVVPGPLPVAVALALQALRARSRVASSMRKINRQLASGADASGTVAMLEKMKHKVQEEESLAEAYDSLVDVGGTIDDDINRALAAPSSSAGADALAELRAKMGGREAGAVRERIDDGNDARDRRPAPARGTMTAPLPRRRPTSNMPRLLRRGDHVRAVGFHHHHRIPVRYGSDERMLWLTCLESAPGWPKSGPSPGPTTPRYARRSAPGWPRSAMTCAGSTSGCAPSR